MSVKTIELYIITLLIKMSYICHVCKSVSIPLQIILQSIKYQMTGSKRIDIEEREKSCSAH